LLPTAPAIFISLFDHGTTERRRNTTRSATRAAERSASLVEVAARQTLPVVLLCLLAAVIQLHTQQQFLLANDHLSGMNRCATGSTCPPAAPPRHRTLSPRWSRSRRGSGSARS